MQLGLGCLTSDWGQLRFLNLCTAMLLPDDYTTPNPHAIDLTKGTDVPESARLLLNDPHADCYVPSFHAMRTVVSA